MKIHRGKEYIHIDLSSAEAAWLLEELETVRGGAKLPKLRQVCEGLRSSIGLGVAMAAPKTGRPPKPKEVSPEVREAAAQLGRLGGLKGGEARAASLPASERSRIAREAAEVRWHGPRKS